MSQAICIDAASTPDTPMIPENPAPAIPAPVDSAPSPPIFLDPTFAPGETWATPPLPEGWTEPPPMPTQTPAEGPCESVSPAPCIPAMEPWTPGPPVTGDPWEGFATTPHSTPWATTSLGTTMAPAPTAPEVFDPSDPAFFTPAPATIAPATPAPATPFLEEPSGL